MITSTMKVRSRCCHKFERRAEHCKVCPLVHLLESDSTESAQDGGGAALTLGEEGARVRELLLVSSGSNGRLSAGDGFFDSAQEVA